MAQQWGFRQSNIPAILNPIMFLQLSYIAQNYLVGYLYVKLCPDDGMFELAIRNKLNTAAATVLHFVKQVYHSFTNDDFLYKISYSCRE